MCIYMCLCVHTNEHAHVYIHREVRGQFQESSGSIYGTCMLCPDRPEEGTEVGHHVGAEN